MRIAIIDGMNHDIGLKILFPEADYFIKEIEFEERHGSFEKYDITPLFDWSLINDQNYDYLFMILASYSAKQGTDYFNPKIFEALNEGIDIIQRNNFKKVFVFDNCDYDYDPNDIIQNEKITLFFKRNYNQTKKYRDNVIPFPFIMFGHISLLEKIDSFHPDNYGMTNKIDRVFFTGQIFTHHDPVMNVYRDRNNIYNKIHTYIYNPSSLNYHDFLETIKTSKFSLDLNGVGDPNKRTFEILSQGSLRIGEYNDLKWPFEERFSDETIFKDDADFFTKINRLRNDFDLYTKCLQNQLNIVYKYFNKSWLRNYILEFMNN